MAITYKRLYNTNGRVAIREAISAADAAAWLPTANADILDAREWEKIRVRPEFDVAPGGTGSVTVEMLMRVPSDSGYEWVVGASTVIGVDESAEFSVDGHFVSFRVTTYVKGTSSTVSIVGTGGQWLRPGCMH